MTDLCKEIERLGKGIGSVPRYRILEALFAGPKTVGQIAKQTRLSQPLASQHLRVLKEVGLVSDARRGQEVVYAINVKYMAGLLKKLTASLPKQ